MTDPTLFDEIHGLVYDYGNCLHPPRTINIQRFHPYQKEDQLIEEEFNAEEIEPSTPSPKRKLNTPQAPRKQQVRSVEFNSPVYEQLTKRIIEEVKDFNTKGVFGSYLGRLRSPLKPSETGLISGKYGHFNRVLIRGKTRLQPASAPEYATSERYFATQDRFDDFEHKIYYVYYDYNRLQNINFKAGDRIYIHPVNDYNDEDHYKLDTEVNRMAINLVIHREFIKKGDEYVVNDNTRANTYGMNHSHIIAKRVHDNRFYANYEDPSMTTIIFDEFSHGIYACDGCGRRGVSWKSDYNPEYEIVSANQYKFNGVSTMKCTACWQIENRKAKNMNLLQRID